MPLLYLLIAQAFQLAFRGKYRIVGGIILATVFVMFLDGGGFMTFILRSDPSWYWANPLVVHANQTAQHILRHIVVVKQLAF